MRQAGNQTSANWVTDICHHNGNGAGGIFGCCRRHCSTDDNNVNFETNQLGCKLRGARQLLLQKAALDRDIFSLDPAKLAQLVSERIHEHGASGCTAWIEIADAKNLSSPLRL